MLGRHGVGVPRTPHRHAAPAGTVPSSLPCSGAGPLGSAAPEAPRCHAACRALPVPLVGPRSPTGLVPWWWGDGRRQGTRASTQLWCHGKRSPRVGCKFGHRATGNAQRDAGGGFLPRSQQGLSCDPGISGGTVLCSAVLHSWASSRSRGLQGDAAHAPWVSPQTAPGCLPSV